MIPLVARANCPRLQDKDNGAPALQATARWSPNSWMTVRELTTHDWLADRKDIPLVDWLLGWLEEGQGFCLWVDKGRIPSH